jgi:hypothetical protein
VTEVGGFTFLAQDDAADYVPGGASVQRSADLLGRVGELAGMFWASYLSEEREVPALVKVVQTCRACPSQWDAWDAAGQYYYLRFRSGLGSVETAESPKAYEDPGNEPVLIAHFTHEPCEEGECWYSAIGLTEFLELAGMRLADGAEVR